MIAEDFFVGLQRFHTMDTPPWNHVNDLVDEDESH